MFKKKYGEGFFSILAAGAYTSAKNTVPIITNLLHPKSVVDLGCGAGSWLKAFEEEGVKDILGVEGEYVKNQNTYIGKENFRFHDLTHQFTTDRRYDLAVSLEVGEHLPAEDSVSFVESLCKLSDVVLFSAAITGQEGTMHINEQFPEYWADIFKQFGYLPADYIRPKIWANENVEMWYRQNILLYLNSSKIPALPKELIECQQQTFGDCLLRVHPIMYMRALKRKYPYQFANYWWYRFKRYFKSY